MTLYEISDAITSLIDPETGEILDINEFDKLGLEFNDKIESIACWIKNLTSDAEAIKAEEKSLAERRKAMESKAERLKEYLAAWLNGQKFETSKVKCSFRKSSSVEITDPVEFVKWANEAGKTYLLNFKAPEPNKTMIKDYIKDGGTVVGAAICEKNSLSIK